MTGTEGEDWAGYQDATPSTTGLGFVMVKATEGTGYTNPRHATQIATSRAHGLVVGHYHFARPGSMTAQADYFLRQTAARPGDVLAFDWEDTGVSGTEKDAWLRYVQVKAPGHRVVLYCNRDFWLHRDSTSYAADGLWIADPSAPKGQPRITAPWLFHQYGSPGGLDRNYTPLSAAQLRAWAAGTTTPTVQEDDMPTPRELWGYHGEISGKADPQDAYAYLRGTNAAVWSLTAQLAALTATVGALAATGGLTATEITAAAKAGADAALAELGDALTTAGQPTP